MSKGDPDFMRVQINFVMNDPRFVSMTPSHRMVYLVLWALCVQSRRETLPAHYSPVTLPTLAHCSPKVFRAAWLAIQERALGEEVNGCIKLYGVRGWHEKLKWKEPPVSPPYPPDNGPSKSKSKRKSSKPIAMTTTEEPTVKWLIKLYRGEVKPSGVDKSPLKAVRSRLVALLRSGVHPQTLERCVRRYSVVCKRTDTDLQYRKGLQKFFGEKFEVWKEYAEDDYEPPADLNAVPMTDALRAIAQAVEDKQLRGGDE